MPRTHLAKPRALSDSMRVARNGRSAHARRRPAAPRSGQRGCVAATVMCAPELTRVCRTSRYDAAARLPRGSEGCCDGSGSRRSAAYVGFPFRSVDCAVTPVSRVGPVGANGRGAFFQGNWPIQPAKSPFFSGWLAELAAPCGAWRLRAPAARADTSLIGPGRGAQWQERTHAGPCEMNSVRADAHTHLSRGARALCELCMRHTR